MIKFQQLSVNPSPRQQLKPSLSKTLKQQIDQLSQQQWIFEDSLIQSGIKRLRLWSCWLEAEQAYNEMVMD